MNNLVDSSDDEPDDFLNEIVNFFLIFKKFKFIFNIIILTKL